jgi:hypothetical protein
MKRLHAVTLRVLVITTIIIVPLEIFAQNPTDFATFIVKRVCLKKKTLNTEEWICMNGNSGHFSETNLSPRARWDHTKKRFRFGYGLEFRIPYAPLPIKPYAELLYPFQTSSKDTYTAIRVEFATEFGAKLLRVSIMSGFGPRLEDWQNTQGVCGCNCPPDNWVWREQEFEKNFRISRQLLAPTVMIYPAAPSDVCIY